MNTTVSYSSELGPHSRRCSTETIYSIQDRETDLLRDTSDTEWCESDLERLAEFEPVTDSEEGGPIDGDSSGNSDNEIISTKVIEVTSISIKEYDGDQEYVDSEQAASDSDSEMDFYDYWNCAQCRAQNNNPLYRYCEKCFKVRKNFFPSRPRRKHKLSTRLKGETLTHTLSKDSGVESVTNSQELSQELSQEVSQETDNVDGPSQSTDVDDRLTDNVILGRKRRAESVDRKNKRIKTEYSGSESDSEPDSQSTEVKPLVKMVSDPLLMVDEPDTIKLTKKAIANSLKEKLDNDNMCIICYSEPKSGVFVHGRIAHICCCYKCARQVWAKAKRCPVCNCKVSNVLKAVVM